MNPWAQDTVVGATLAGGVWLLRAAARSEDWRDAWRDLRARRLAMVSLGVLAAYAAVGLADSVVWGDATLLDRLAARCLPAGEKTYSSPFATRAYARETARMPDGRIARDYPPLRHPGVHPFGTDRIGNDVLLKALKGVRTALIIGGFTTLLIIPLAVVFGVLAGYYGRRVDDAIRYVYTTLESVPDVLLIAAFMLIAGRKLHWLCLILGVTSWTHLCRILRGETLKLREAEFVQAARALGASDARVMIRHIVPNLMPLVVIVFVLRFSGLVLTEAVLTYLGLGVDPGTGSWGHMINAARQELTREPVVWWNLGAAFTLMLGLVLSANLLGDALRDALDPRLRER